MKSFLSFALSIVFCAGAAAQQQPAEEPAPTISVDVNELGTITVDVDIVNVLFSVRDKNRRLVPNLTKDDFTLLEDGVEQEIKYFSPRNGSTADDRPAGGRRARARKR